VLFGPKPLRCALVLPHRLGYAVVFKRQGASQPLDFVVDGRDRSEQQRLEFGVGEEIRVQPIWPMLASGSPSRLWRGLSDDETRPAKLRRAKPASGLCWKRPT
jgi:hypothetical protein